MLVVVVQTQDDLECKEEKRRLKKPSDQVKIWGPPLASPPTEPGSRHEKVSDKGREIQDHAIMGPPVPSTPVRSPSPNLHIPDGLGNNNFTSQGRGEEPRQANIVEGMRR